LATVSILVVQLVRDGLLFGAPRSGSTSGHRQGRADGYGCSDLGDGRHLVGLLQRRDQQDNPRWIVRRTEIDLNGATATIGRSDTVPATSDQDPAWTTAGQISCGDLTMERDGLWAPY
jgi:hypothetical protein